jgi:hypothetical protein
MIRNCKLRHTATGYVHVTGLCKKHKMREVILSEEEYEDWKGGIPLHYAAPNLTIAERNFLTKGEWE